MLMQKVCLTTSVYLWCYCYGHILCLKRIKRIWYSICITLMAKNNHKIIDIISATVWLLGGEVEDHKSPRKLPGTPLHINTPLVYKLNRYHLRYRDRTSYNFYGKKSLFLYTYNYRPKNLGILLYFYGS